jgi:hypothetical protein
VIARIFHGWFTGTDNQHFELGRALWALGCLAMIAYQGAALFVLKQPFNPIEFGTGLAAILAAGGFGVAAKDKANPS